jgi:hypothetical protein
MIEADDDVEMIDISNVKIKSQIRAKLKNNDIYAKKQPTPEPSQPVAKGKNKSAEMLFLGIESDEEDEVGEGDEDPMSQELDDIAASKSPEPVPKNKNKNKSQDNQLDKKQKSKARPSSAPMQDPDLGQDPEHHPPAPKRAKHAEPIKKFASIFDSSPTQASSSARPSIFSQPIRRAKGELQVEHNWSLDPDEP